MLHRSKRFNSSPDGLFRRLPDVARLLPPVPKQQFNVIEKSWYNSKTATPSIFMALGAAIGITALFVYRIWSERHYTKTLNIQYNQNDLSIRKDKIPSWFDAFYINTNEKVVIQSQLKDVFALLGNHSYPILFSKTAPYLNQINVVLDIGCCSGDLHTRTAWSLNQAVSKPAKINFVGLDNSPKAIAKVEDEFRQSPEKYTALLPKPHQVDFFQEDQLAKEYFANILIELTSRLKADLIIVSHIAYYAPDITSFVSAILATRDHHGFIVFIHESETSVAKLMAKKYNAPINANTSPMIKVALKDALRKGDYISIYSKTIYSKIVLPMGIREFIEYWSGKTKINYDTRSHDDFFITQKLLEFIFQVPFETLREKGLATELTHDLTWLAEGNDNEIVIKSNLELVVPATFKLTDAELKGYGFYQDGQEHALQDYYYQILHHKNHIHALPEYV